jgi:hypothetical protein
MFSLAAVEGDQQEKRLSTGVAVVSAIDLLYNQVRSSSSKLLPTQRTTTFTLLAGERYPHTLSGAFINI